VARRRDYPPARVRRALRKYALVEQQLAVAPGMDLRLLAVDDAYSLLDRMVEQEARALQRAERYPYWAEVWPAAVGLARWFCTSGAAPPPASALELGCGLGLVGIVLARLGWQVEATDFVEDALVFATRNAVANQVAARHRVGYLDWANPTGEPAPCVVASDVLYEPKNHRHLLRVLQHLLEPGGWFFTSDPGRAPAPGFLGLLTAAGYQHTPHRVELCWQGFPHVVDIHALRKPPAGPLAAASGRVDGGYGALSQDADVRGDLRRGQRFRIEPRGLVGLRRVDTQRPAQDPCEEDEVDVLMVRANRLQQHADGRPEDGDRTPDLRGAEQLHAQPGLLGDLTHGGGLGQLRRLDVPARGQPGLALAVPQQQGAALPDDERRGGEVAGQDGQARLHGQRAGFAPGRGGGPARAGAKQYTGGRPGVKRAPDQGRATGGGPADATC
jgi:predicted nicotinamide N-methyase